MIKSNISKISNMLTSQRISSCVKGFVDSNNQTTITPAYCVSRLNNPICEKLIKSINEKSSLPFYFKNGDNDDEVVGTQSRISIILNVPITSLPFTCFNFDLFFSNLETCRFGQTVVYSQVTTSTIEVIEPLTSIDGLLAIAGQQTRGRGRSGNEWISPKGCAMFSLSFHISLSSRLGQSLGLVQHLISLAIFRGITRLPGYEKSDLHLKWPNDIYWGKTIKIGGIIVSSSLIGTDVHCVAHCGINVNNSHPAQPLNQLLADHPETKDLPPLTIEELIARTLNELDYLIKEIERSGIETIKKLYIQHWLHTNQKITMADNKEVIIKGIDDHGYMLVQESSGKILTVQPDGNRFDMMQNLIVKK